MFHYHFDDNSHLIYKTHTKPFDKLLTLLCEGTFFQKLGKVPCFPYKIFQNLCEKTDQKIGTFTRARIFRNLTPNPQRIVFSVFQGTYTCNCKYIAERILELGLDYQLIFLVPPHVYYNRKEYDFPPQVYLCKMRTQEAFYALATSKYWFDNALGCIWKMLPKKEGQIYINTWHGSLGIKKLSGNDFWKDLARKSNHMIDYFLTDSTFDEEVFSGSFWPDVKFLKVGHPRNDIFFDPDRIRRLREKVHLHYHIPDSTKILLYAPTFRDNKEDLRAIHLDFTGVTEAAGKRFGGKWVVLQRLHFHNLSVSEKAGASLSSENVIDASAYPDMQELLAAADAGITDYSSWIFDFLFTRKPAFIYAADIQQYIHDRGFYYGLNETPFSISDSEEVLFRNILSFDEEAYLLKVQQFLKDKGCYEKGTASQQVADFLAAH